MALPNKDALDTLDFAFKGQPFDNVGAFGNVTIPKFGFGGWDFIVTASGGGTTEEFVFKAQPFYYP